MILIKCALHCGLRAHASVNILNNTAGDDSESSAASHCFSGVVNSTEEPSFIIAKITKKKSGLCADYAR